MTKELKLIILFFAILIVGLINGTLGLCAYSALITGVIAGLLVWMFLE